MSINREARLSCSSAHSITSAKNLLMFFGPMFNQFGCDIARALVERYGRLHVHGLCTTSGVHDHVANELGEFGGQFWQLEGEEERWLSTPASTDQLTRFERELGLGAFGRIVTADRRVGRGYVRGGLIGPNSIDRVVARDPAAAAQRYVSGLYCFLNNVLNETKTETVFSYDVAGAPALALAELCGARGIRYCRLATTRIGNQYTIDDDPLGRQVRVARRFMRAREACEPFAPEVFEEAHRWLESFRKGPVQPGYMTTIRTPHLLREFVYFPHRVLREILYVRRPQIGRPLFEIRIALRRHFTGRSWFASSSDLTCPFIYFPLHVNPEASTMVLTPWHTDQLSVIEALAKAAPAHMQVVVKEHGPMLGRRPRGFYQQIARMPRVTLLGPGHSSFDLIRKARLTAVISGTAAWEAILLGKPTLIIGDSPFLVIRDGLVHEPALHLLPDAIVKAVGTPPVSDDVLIDYIAAIMVESFYLPPGLIWGKYTAQPLDLRRSSSSAIAEKIFQYISTPARSALGEA